MPKSRKDKVLFVQYCPKDFIEGVLLLSPLEELAYRRICDLIYLTDDNVDDDSRRLGEFTKTYDEWSEIRSSLIDMGKLKLTDDGRLTNERATRELTAAKTRIKARQKGGKRSGESRRKSLENKGNRTQHELSTNSARVEHELTINDKRQTVVVTAADSEKSDPPRAIIAAFERAIVDVYGPDLARPYPNQRDYPTATNFHEQGLSPDSAYNLFRSAQERHKASKPNSGPIAVLHYFDKIVPEYLAAPANKPNGGNGAAKPYVSRIFDPVKRRRERIDSYVRVGLTKWPFPVTDDPPPTDEELQESRERQGIEP